jgi:multiple sugar transport system substrate-binding protein
MDRKVHVSGKSRPAGRKREAAPAGGARGGALSRREFIKGATGAAMAVGATGALLPRLSRPAEAQGAVEIELSTWHWTEPERGDALRKMVADFTKEHPNIKVKEGSIPYPRYEDTLMVRLAGGNSPDVLVAADTMFFSFLTHGYLQSLNSLLNLGKYKSDFLPIQAVANIKGQTMGVVSEYVTYALLSNERLLKEAGISKPPATADEFLAAAKKLTKAPDQYGYGTRHTMDQEAGWWYELSFWVEGFGGKWADGKKPTVNSSSLVGGIRFFKQMYDAGIFPKGVDSATYRRMFWQEKVAMLTDNQAVYVITKSQNPKIELGATNPPFKPPLTNAEIVLYTIPKGSRHVKEAVMFLDWFYRHLGDYGMAVHNVVNSKSANTAIIKQFPYLQTFVSLPVADNGGILPRGFETRLPEFRHTVLTHVTDVLVNNVDPQKAMDAAQAELEQKLLKK